MEQSLSPIRHYAIRLFDNLEETALYVRNFFVAPVLVLTLVLKRMMNTTHILSKAFLMSSLVMIKKMMSP